MSVPFAPQDDVLERQLAHLDSIERRQIGRAEPGSTESAEIRPLSVQPRWPRGVPPPPSPAESTGSLGPYLSWLEFACAIMESRVEANEGELERLRSQWVHVVSNIDRLRPEEIDAVVESQARLRETIASDAALHEVLRSQHDQLLTWSESLASPLTDPVLVRRLLDDAAIERGNATRALTASIVQQLTTLLLDLEITERRLSRDPGVGAPLLQELRERVAGATARVRDQALGDDIAAVQPGESLQRALHRIADTHAGQTSVDLLWSGEEVRDPEVALAVAWVVMECLRHVAAVPGGSCRIEVDALSESTSVRIVTPTSALLPDGDPGWLVRARARAAVAGGRLLSGRSGDGSGVEVRF